MQPERPAGQAEGRSRRTLLLLPLLALAAPLAAATPTRIEVWKAPTCGCCKDWIAHLQANGFVAVPHDDGNDAARRRLGMPMRHGSCHTALVDGYVIEGHVPAREIRRLLSERPRALGLAVPAMPVGSPGMDGPAYGGRKDPYDVLLVARDGTASIYRSYR
ncbi:MAG: DUF411 domain-containing protein [Comamonadaceae bacterium]|nr:DUF411 domain-containing protein [Rubrivivax sp.]NLZ40417.1 DUF411 domain-containing protein [Comamonadaceae bacterium]